jgi:hypothetical protein
MNNLRRVIKNVVKIDLIGSVVLSILILGYIGSTNLQRDQVPSEPGISTTQQ